MCVSCLFALSMLISPLFASLTNPDITENLFFNQNTQITSLDDTALNSVPYTTLNSSFSDQGKNNIICIKIASFTFSKDFKNLYIGAEQYHFQTSGSLNVVTDDGKYSYSATFSTFFASETDSSCYGEFSPDAQTKYQFDTAGSNWTWFRLGNVSAGETIDFYYVLTDYSWEENLSSGSAVSLQFSLSKSTDAYFYLKDDDAFVLNDNTTQDKAKYYLINSQWLNRSIGPIEITGGKTKVRTYTFNIWQGYGADPEGIFESTGFADTFRKLCELDLNVTGNTPADKTYKIGCQISTANDFALHPDLDSDYKQDIPYELKFERASAPIFSTSTKFLLRGFEPSYSLGLDIRIKPNSGVSLSNIEAGHYRDIIYFNFTTDESNKNGWDSIIDL